ncbi:MAG: hypothetical protein LBG81_08850 [Coriobacteriaceae bacterium]|nr:hypothetical protein [Coriobacteriaceae bacterium]
MDALPAVGCLDAFWALRSGASTSAGGSTVPAAWAIALTRLGMVVTTMTGTPASRRSAAWAPTCSLKPATMTAMSDSGNTGKAEREKYRAMTCA